MRPSTRKIGIFALLALLVAFLLPLQAFATSGSADSASSSSSASPVASASSASSAISATSATPTAPSITIGGTEYTEAADGKGSDGGTWSWDGKSALALDGYSGGGILATGDLDITLSGQNTITSGATVTIVSGHGMSYGIYTEDGDLSITGDGLLAIDVEDDVLGENFAIGVEASNGDISISDTSVDVTCSGYGMAAADGNIDISGSEVLAASTVSGDGIIAGGKKSGKGNVTISGSDVIAAGTDGCAIGATSGRGAKDASKITIDDSNVIATSDVAGAMMACSTSSDCSGVIVITGGTIVSPEAMSVLDVTDTAGSFYGQTIGTGADSLTYFCDEDGNLNPAVSSSVAIAAADSSDSAASGSSASSARSASSTSSTVSASSAASANPTASSITIDGAQYTKAADGKGSDGGTWSWDGKSELALDGYSGGGIVATGDLNITLSGKNAITSGVAAQINSKCSIDCGIRTTDGDLTITGDGSINVDIEDDASDSSFAYGIKTKNGDISITDSTVNVTSGYGISASNGNLAITGSKVAAVSASFGTSLTATNVVAGKGNITITDSDVKAQSAEGVTIWAGTGTGVQSAPSITIVNSTVDARSDGCIAIMACGSSSEYPGAITITGGAITSPEGANVLDFAFDDESGYGQTVGTGAGPLPYISDDDDNLNPDVATSVTIAATEGSIAAVPYAL